jgi:tetratricopeptide (TPR) repeat protein
VGKKTKHKKGRLKRPPKHAVAVPSQPPARSRRRPIGAACAILLLAAIATASYLTWQRRHRPLPIPIPEELEQLSPELVDLINRQVEAVKADPRSAHQYATLGLIYEANSLWPAARDCFETATSLEDDNPLWPHHTAFGLRGAGDSEGALAWLRRYGERYPAFAPLQNSLGNVLLEAGAVDEAAAAFRRTIASAPSEADGYVGLGEVMMQRGDYAEAARLLEQAVERDPEYKTARFLLGMTYRRLGREEEARAELTQGLKSQRREIDEPWAARRAEFDVGAAGRTKWAMHLIDAGRPGEAVKILEAVVASRPDNVHAAMNLAIAYAQAQGPEKARELLLRTEKLDNTRFSLYVNLASSSLDLDRPFEALRYADRAVELAPDVSKTHLVRGRALRQLDRPQEALEALSTAARRDPQDPDIYRQLARLCLELGRFAEARQYYRKQADLTPFRWQPYFGLCQACVRLGQLEEATDAILTAQRIAPEEPKVRALAEQVISMRNR